MEINELKINDRISIIASGLSILKLKEDDFEQMKNNSFIVNTNYPVGIHCPSITPDLYVWSDKRVSDFYEKYFEQSPHKKSLIMVINKFEHTMNPIHYTVDIRIDKKKEKNLIGNFTAIWTLQLLMRSFPECYIDVYGAAGNYSIDNMRKWIDYYTDFDMQERKTKYPEEKIINYRTILSDYIKDYTHGKVNIIS